MGEGSNSIEYWQDVLLSMNDRPCGFAHERATERPVQCKKEVQHGRTGCTHSSILTDAVKALESLGVLHPQQASAYRNALKATQYRLHRLDAQTAFIAIGDVIGEFDDVLPPQIGIIKERRNIIDELLEKIDARTRSTTNTPSELSLTSA